MLNSKDKKGMKYNSGFILSVLSVVLSLSSCADFMDRYPLDSPSTETFYSNDEEMTLALNGCYTNITFLAANVMPFELNLDMMSDIGWERTAGSQPQIVWQGSHNANSGIFYDIWNNYYKGIGRCNRLLEGMEKGRENHRAPKRSRDRLRPGFSGSGSVRSSL